MARRQKAKRFELAGPQVLSSGPVSRARFSRYEEPAVQAKCRAVPVRTISRGCKRALARQMSGHRRGDTHSDAGRPHHCGGEPPNVFQPARDDKALHNYPINIFAALPMFRGFVEYAPAAERQRAKVGTRCAAVKDCRHARWSGGDRRLGIGSRAPQVVRRVNEFG